LSRWNEINSILGNDLILIIIFNWIIHAIAHNVIGGTFIGFDAARRSPQITIFSVSFNKRILRNPTHHIIQSRAWGFIFINKKDLMKSEDRFSIQQIGANDVRMSVITIIFWIHCADWKTIRIGHLTYLDCAQNSRKI